METKSSTSSSWKIGGEEETAPETTTRSECPWTGISPHFKVYENEQQWADDARHYIGASEAWSIVSGRGVIETWARKVRPEMVEAPPRALKLRWAIGHALEDTIAEYYALDTGHEQSDPGKYTRWVHPDLPWLACTPDRLFRPKPGEGYWGPLELKTLPEILQYELEGNEYSGWDKRAPLPYQTQVYHQMIVLQSRFACVAGLIFNQKLRIIPHFVEYDPKVGEWIFEKLATFWDTYVLGDSMPPADDDHKALATLQRLFPTSEPGKVFVMPREWNSLLAQWDELQTQESSAKKAREKIKAKLMHACGDAAEIQTPSGETAWTWQEDASGSRRFNRKKGGAA